MSTSKAPDASIIAQKATSKWAHMSWEQREQLRSILDTNVSTASEVMNCIRALPKKSAALQQLEVILSEKIVRVNVDDLLSYYVGHESKFTISQKNIMGSIVQPNFVGNADIIITSAMVQSEKADEQNLVRLERTMKHCVAMYVPPALPQVFPPSFYGGAHGVPFNK